MLMCTKTKPVVKQRVRRKGYAMDNGSCPAAAMNMPMYSLGNVIVIHSLRIPYGVIKARSIKVASIIGFISQKLSAEITTKADANCSRSAQAPTSFPGLPLYNISNQWSSSSIKHDSTKHPTLRIDSYVSRSLHTSRTLDPAIPVTK